MQLKGENIKLGLLKDEKSRKLCDMSEIGGHQNPGLIINLKTSKQKRKHGSNSCTVIK